MFSFNSRFLLYHQRSRLLLSSSSSSSSTYKGSTCFSCSSMDMKLSPSPKNLCFKCDKIEKDFATGWKENHGIASMDRVRFPFVTLPRQFSEMIFDDEKEKQDYPALKNTKFESFTDFEVRTRRLPNPNFDHENEQQKQQVEEKNTASDREDDKESQIENRSKGKLSDIFAEKGDQDISPSSSSVSSSTIEIKEDDENNQSNTNHHPEKYLPPCDYDFAFPLTQHLTDLEIRELPAISFKGPVLWVIDTHESIQRFKDHIFNRVSGGGNNNTTDETKAQNKKTKKKLPVVLGLDTESRPAIFNPKGNRSFQKQHQNQKSRNGEVCLVQIATRTAVFLMRPAGAPKIQQVLIQIFESPKILKVGVALTHDIRELQSILHFKPKAFLDLQNAVRNAKLPRLGLSAMSATILGRKVSKTFQMSDWSKKLGQNQIIYAATDAWLCLVLFRRFLHCGLVRPFEEELLVGRQPLLCCSNDNSPIDESMLAHELFFYEGREDVIEANKKRHEQEIKEEEPNKSTSNKINDTKRNNNGDHDISGFDTPQSNRQDHTCHLMMTIKDDPQHFYLTTPLESLVWFLRTYGLVKEIRRFTVTTVSPSSTSSLEDQQPKEEKTFILDIHCGSAVVADRISKCASPQVLHDLLTNSSSSSKLSSSTKLSSSAMRNCAIVPKSTFDSMIESEERKQKDKELSETTTTSTSSPFTVETFTENKLSKFQGGKKSHVIPTRTLCVHKITFVSRGDVKRAIHKLSKLLHRHGFIVLDLQQQQQRDEKNDDDVAVKNNDSNISDLISSLPEGDKLIKSVYHKNKDIFIEANTARGALHVLMELNMRAKIECDENFVSSVVASSVEDDDKEKEKDKGDSSSSKQGSTEQQQQLHQKRFVRLKSITFV